MAYANWVTPDKISGSGNGTVSWVGSEHTGRSPRSTTATFSASGVTSKTLTINQAGKTEFVDIADTQAVSKNGGSITITGTSNSKKLTFTLTLPATYIANSVSTNNGADISGNPGATQQYAFSITFTGIAANTTLSTKTSQLTVTTENGTTDTCDITQAAGDAYLNIAPTTINLSAAGVADNSVTVESNTSWTVS